MHFEKCQKSVGTLDLKKTIEICKSVFYISAFIKLISQWKIDKTTSDICNFIRK